MSNSTVACDVFAKKGDKWRLVPASFGPIQRQENALIDALREDARYVEIKANNDLAFLLSPGYKPVSTNRAQTPLQQVEIVSVSTPENGALKMRVKLQRNVRYFLGRIKPARSEFGPSISFASSRKIPFDSVSMGVKYTLQLCAVGGSNDQSDWSDPVEKMAI